VGLGFELATGLAVTAVSLLTAHFIAASIFNKPGTTLLIIVGSLSVFASSLVRTSQNIFIGFERMHLYSYTLICQAVTQTVLAPLLVILGYGALGAVVGYTLSTVVSGIAGLGLLYFYILKKLPRNTPNIGGSVQTLKMMLTYGFPLGISLILGGLLPQIASILMASLVKVTTIGDYKIATNFAVLLAFFTLPISTVLFPAFSKLNPKNESQLLKSVFTSSVKYASILLVPATMAIIVLSQPLIETIYGSKYPYAPYLLALTATGTLLVIFGNLSWSNLFSGCGETKLLSKLQILSVIIGIPLTFLAAIWFGLPGIIVAGILAGVPSLFIGLYLISKRYGATVDLRSSAKIFIASLIATGITYAFLNEFLSANLVRFLVGVLLFLAVYIVAIPLLGAINQDDIKNLGGITSEMGIASRVFNIPLKIMEKILKNNYRKSKKNKI
jgi:O-antigen/teichoic acid export membrane protein